MLTDKGRLFKPQESGEDRKEKNKNKTIKTKGHIHAQEKNFLKRNNNSGSQQTKSEEKKFLCHFRPVTVF